MVAYVGQGALNAVVAPGGILFGESQDQIHDDLADTRSADRLTLPAVVPFLCHKLAVPAKDRVGYHDRGQFLQCFATERHAFDCQNPPLLIGQQYSFLAVRIEQSHNLGILKLDDFLLSAVDHAGEDGQQQLPRLQNEAHGMPRMLNLGDSVSMRCAMTVVNRPKSAIAEPRQP